MSEPPINAVGTLPEPLTRREREVLALLAEGLTAPEMAARLTLATSSVKSHLQHLYAKLGVNGRRQAVARARALGLIAPATRPIPTESAAANPPVLHRHNLPQPLSRLIGRTPELEELTKLLTGGSGQSVRLVTLVGPGGVGKTRLALALAHQVLDHYRDTAWLIELAPLSDPDLLVGTVAATLGLGDYGGGSLGPAAARPLIETLIDFLHAKHCLLMFDNCEHLVAASARLAETLMKRCPQLQLVATSREPLGTAGEVTWPVVGLATPPTAPPASLELQAAHGYAAIELFTERARAARPGFRLTARNVASLAQICQQLDGLPLAIELAAARVALLPVEQIAARLDAHEGFHLLTGGRRTALPRHQTLLATIEWSYQLLAEPERRLLRRVTVFSGGWSLEMAEAVCADAPDDHWRPSVRATDVLETLGQLAAKSLVVSDHSAGGEARFRLLETIREFALAQLEVSGEAAAIRQRHFDYFLALAERAEPETRGPHQKVWFDLLTREHDNVRRALEWTLQSRSVELGLRLASALHRFWDVRGHIPEAATWCERLLGVGPQPERSLTWAMGLARATAYAHCFCNNELARRFGKASLALSRELGAAGWASAAYALMELGTMQLFPNPSEPDVLGPEFPDSCEAILQESVALFELSGDTWGQATVLQRIGWVATLEGRTHAGRSFAQSQALFEQLGDLSGMARVCVEMGHLAMADGDYEQACELHEAALGQYRQLGAPQSIADTLCMLAEALGELGQYQPAMAALEESAELVRNLGHLGALRWNLSEQAEVAYDYGQYEATATLQAESRQVAAKLGDTDWLAMLEIACARLARAQGDPMRAIGHIEAVIPFFRAGGHVYWMAYANEALGEAWRDCGDYARAQEHLEASLAFFQSRRNWREVTGLLLRLGGVARRQGQVARSAGLLGECLRRCHPSEPTPLMAACLLECASLATQAAKTDGILSAGEHAAGLLGAYHTFCDAIRVPFPPADQAERAAYEGAVSTLNDLLGAKRFVALQQASAVSGTEQAVNETLAHLAQLEQPHGAGRSLPPHA